MTWKHDILKRYRRHDLITICIDCRMIKHDGEWREYKPHFPYRNYSGGLCDTCFDNAREYNRWIRWWERHGHDQRRILPMV